ncbi:asparagine synthase (glutamine-hydrolyzing) [Pseudonocardia sp. ICBG1122]|nr:asparagine synthase (glutamine-hydrolyzing) [Pseudonocardia pini]
MCGITGFVDWEKPISRPAIDSMTGTLSPRGPDASGVWTGPHVALGHTRLIVLDPVGGAQPMHVDDPAGSLVLTYSGEVYNHAALRRELSSRGHVFSTRSDTEVVLRAWLEWGPDCVDRLAGMYAFAVWDRRSEQLWLVRDRLGIKPLFYASTPTGLVFGSEPKALLAHPDVDAVVDEHGVAELFGLAPMTAPGSAVLRGIVDQRPASVVRVDRAGIHTRTYWELPVRDHSDDLPTTVATVRAHLERIVTEQLVADVPVSALLSGGVDSSAIAALATRLRGADAVPP